ncbi:substrate-binding periplasmic protein [Chitinimonas lacunae]|uniref:Substrate-binding periplasmic protein n=1 Tax=Chitinimonas lacunae TaxID=1963018 RepID=A0ABV8MJP8_9NEIS
MKPCWILLALAATAPVAAWAEDKPASIKLCYENEDVYPWILKSGKGLNILHLEAVAKKTGLKLELVGLPWKRCLSELQAGTMDGAFAASYKDDRAVYAAYPMKDGKHDPARRMMFDSYSLYRTKGSNLGWDGSKFSNLSGKIGVQSGYSIIDQLKAAGANLDEGAKAADDNLKKLAGGRVQGVALLTVEADNSLKGNPEFANIEKVSPPLVEKPYYLMLAKPFHAKYPKASEDLWAAVAAVRESPEYKAQEQAFFKK